MMGLFWVLELDGQSVAAEQAGAGTSEGQAWAVLGVVESFRGSIWEGPREGAFQVDTAYEPSPVCSCRGRWRSCTLTPTSQLRTSTSMGTGAASSGWSAPASFSW